MKRDEEIKLKVGTIIDEAVGEKKKARRRLLVWIGSTCAAILVASITFAIYLNKPSPEPPPDAPQGKITFPCSGSKIDRQFNIEGYTRNIPIELPYVGLTVNVNLVFVGLKNPGSKRTAVLIHPFMKAGAERNLRFVYPNVAKVENAANPRRPRGQL